MLDSGICPVPSRRLSPLFSQRRKASSDENKLPHSTAIRKSIKLLHLPAVGIRNAIQLTMGYWHFADRGVIDNLTPHQLPVARSSSVLNIMTRWSQDAYESVVKTQNVFRIVDAINRIGSTTNFLSDQKCVTFLARTKPRTSNSTSRDVIGHYY
jgi:hypothetical protein